MTATRIALVSRDLLFGSRIADAATRAGLDLVRVDQPAQLPPAASVSLVLVDWGERMPGWAATLTGWCEGAPESVGPRILLYGPHKDLDAHEEARAAALGPMWARSKLLAELPALVANARPQPVR